MTASRISARSLLRETFANIGSRYAPLLLINSPILIFVGLNSFGKLGSVGVAFNIIYWLVVVPFLSGAMIFYSYRDLTKNKVTVGQSFTQSNRRLLQLIAASLMCLLLVSAGFIALIIPGFYVSYRLMFSSYATVIDNSSALDSISSSWELTKGRWWLVFSSTLLIILVVFVPILLICLLIDPTGKSVAYQLAANLLGFLAGPLMNVYFVLLYQRLRESVAATQ
ncbi:MULTISPECIES: hypothetical protein [unclassified Microcoleus]|uniref:hypothetical protein n=1 Tax=unclassified Microcoleus TaxID=2642155 RepID=UPI002FD02ED6